MRLQWESAATPSLQLPRVRADVIATVAAAVAVAGFGLRGIQHTEWYRGFCAAIVFGLLITLSLYRPRFAVAATVCYLVLLALMRRLLIPVAGWTSFDPLLLVGPAVSLFLVQALMARERRLIARDRFGKAVFALLLLTLAEVANPLGGGITAGLLGLLFIGVPLLWFLVGQEVADNAMVSGLLAAVVVLAVGEAVYGISQTTFGLPSWDSRWVDLNGYTALSVGKIRGFGTFSSSAEYASFLAIGVVTAFAAALRGHVVYAGAVPVLGVALFLASARSIVILTLLALLVIAGLRTGRVAVAILVVAVGIASAVVAAVVLGTTAEDLAQQTGDPLVIHQVGGLANPLDPNKSTLLLHLQEVTDGISHAVRNPLGFGTGVTNLGVDKTGQPSAGTEIDLSNELVSLGWVGGVLYLLIVVAAFFKVFALHRKYREPLALAAAGTLLVVFGQWLNGGYYAVAPIVWLLIGWASRELSRRDADHAEVGESGEVPRLQAAGAELPR